MKVRSVFARVFMWYICERGEFVCVCARAGGLDARHEYAGPLRSAIDAGDWETVIKALEEKVC